MHIIVLHNPLSQASQDFLVTLGVTIPEGDDVTVTIGTDTVRIVSDHDACVALCPAFPGYPLALVGDGENQRMLAFPDDWAAVAAWSVESLPVFGIQDTKAMAVSRLQTAKWLRLYGEFTDKNGHTYSVDADSRALINGRVTTINAGKPIPKGFVWKTAESDSNGHPIYVPHTAETFVALAFEIDDWTDAVFRASEAAQAVIRDDSVTTVEQIAAIEAGVIWP